MNKVMVLSGVPVGMVQGPSQRGGSMKGHNSEASGKAGFGSLSSLISLSVPWEPVLALAESQFAASCPPFTPAAAPM